MLRDGIKNGTAIGMEAKSYMDRGLLVPDSLIIDMILDRINLPDCKAKGYLLDGFPRSPAQAQVLIEKGIIPDSVILLEAPDQVVIDRISGRRLDPQTGNTYHITYNPPKDDEVKARLVQRSDDTVDKIKVRLQAYHENLKGILKQFQGIIVPVKGDQQKELVTDAVLSALDKVCKTVLYQ